MSKQADLELRARKLQPKLRLLTNGDSTVNTLRAEQTGCLAVKSPTLLRSIPQLRGDGAVPGHRDDLPKRVAKPPHLRAVPREVNANVFVHLRDPNAKPIKGETLRRERLATASVPLSELGQIAERNDVVYVEPGQGLAIPRPLALTTGVGAPAAADRKMPQEKLHKNGRGVLVGIVDVNGFDFSHPDFLDNKKRTRFVRIWDQGGDRRPPPAEFGYGAEFLKEHLDAAIAAAPGLGVPAFEIERQVEIASESHGTHVTSIAAGRLGVAREATLAAVHVSLAPEDSDPRKSFYDSTRIAHAVDYLLKLGEELNMPVSINISLGTNGHAHDGSSAVSRWIDSALARPGRVVSVAAGNAGQERAEHSNDLGFVMGRIHTSGQISASGLTRDIEWNVVGNTRLDISENELEFWYAPQDRFAVSLKPPGGSWIGPIEPREYVENQQLSDSTFVSIYNELYHPANGANLIAIYLSPFLDDHAVVGIRSGKWTIRLHGREVRDGRYHGWIERDDPRPLGPVGKREAWSFPSYFSVNSNVDDSSISSLGCSERIIAVGNLDAAGERINITSSEGPTRDGRTKPDIAAPGTDIVAASGFTGPDDLWVSMTGTSMASPYVCGVAALMLATEPSLTAAQIEAIMRRTARPLPGTASFAWRKDAGYGVIDPEACILEASRLLERKDRTV